MITDKFTGQSRGFGFVEMGSGGEAQKAIQALNGTELDGRTLTVNGGPARRKGVIIEVEVLETEVAGVIAGSLSSVIKEGQQVGLPLFSCSWLLNT